MSDVEHALQRLRALIGPDQHPDELIAFVHLGPPISKARARMMKAGWMYTPKQTTTAQKALALDFLGVSPLGRPPMTCNVAIVAIFYRQNLQRVDGDNLMKLVMDAATEAGVWRDDCQVTAHAALVELDRVNPRTVVAFCPYVSSLNRGVVERVCQGCGHSYERPAWSKTGTKFCSGKCAQARRLVEARCPRCEKPFRRHVAAQRYCSIECRNADRGKRLPNGEQLPPAVCEKCGNPVSKRGYRQCRQCRGFGRPPILKGLEI